MQEPPEEAKGAADALRPAPEEPLSEAHLDLIAAGQAPATEPAPASEERTAPDPPAAEAAEPRSSAADGPPPDADEAPATPAPSGADHVDAAPEPSAAAEGTTQPDRAGEAVGAAPPEAGEPQGDSGRVAARDDGMPSAAFGTAALPTGTPDPAAGAWPLDVAEPDPALFTHALRLAEALVFASDRPVTPQRLQQALPPGVEARAVLTALAAQCADRPVQLVEVAGGFAFRTAPELAPALTRVVEVPRRLPRAAMETLAIIAYHQPVTRAEIEEIRGAGLSQSTLESLLEMGLIAPRGRKEVPGRPSLWGTTPKFLEQFGLRALTDLPRREELVNEPGSPLLAPPAEAAPSA